MQKLLDIIIKILGLFIGIFTLFTLYSHACDFAVTFKYNGAEFESGHQLYHNRMFVPLRTVSERLGLTVEWEEQTKMIEIYNNKTGELAQFHLESKYIWRYNKDSITMDVEPLIIDGRAFLPIRYVAEALGKSVEYFKDDKNVVINITDGKYTQMVAKR